MPTSKIKPRLGGLITRDYPNADHRYDPAFGAFIARVNWLDTEPKRGTYDWSVIEHALSLAAARGKILALRPYSGGEAPDWAKTLSGGGVQIYNPTDQAYAVIGRWWDPHYQEAFAEWQHAMGAAYDKVAEIRMINMTLGGMLYPEPFLRSIGDTPTWNRLHNAGLTTAKDHLAIKAGIQTMRANWPTTSTFVSFNPGQDFDVRRQDEAWSNEAIAYFRQVMPRRAVFFSTSLDAPSGKAPADLRMYQEFIDVGGPRAIQTKQTARVSDWMGMLDYGVKLGMGAIEMSPGGWETRMSPDQALAYSKRLAAQA